MCRIIQSATATVVFSLPLFLSSPIETAAATAAATISTAPLSSFIPTTFITPTKKTSITSQMSKRSKITRAAAKSPLDEEIESFVSEKGYGKVVSSKPMGSSGWASFRRVEVSDPDTPDFFVKSSSRSAKEMFEGEALGLRAMYACSSTTTNDDGLRIPKVYHYGDYTNSKGSLLIMEYLQLAGRSDDRALGRAVANMHLAQPTAEAGNPNGCFGFEVDNTIGGTPQPNKWTKGGSTNDWVEFFRDQRIGHQLHLAGDSYCLKLWENDIAPRLHKLFENVEVRPSLLHGDLWSGNIGSVGDKPTIYDPATYWGHHEAEWGMSWCAGFGKSFWDGYREVIEEEEGFLDRKPLYDAYHQLNHYNLFGGGYLSSARGDLECVKRNLDSL